jgi:hypothetical protein
MEQAMTSLMTTRLTSRTTEQQVVSPPIPSGRNSWTRSAGLEGQEKEQRKALDLPEADSLRYLRPTNRTGSSQTPCHILSTIYPDWSVVESFSNIQFNPRDGPRLCAVQIVLWQRDQTILTTTTQEQHQQQQQLER